MKKVSHQGDENLIFDWLSSNKSASWEINLWIAVLTQAVMDACSKSAQREARYYRRDAIDWLTSNSKDFQFVCINAGMEPSYVMRKAAKAIKEKASFRAAPGKGLRYLDRKMYREKLRALGLPIRTSHAGKITEGIDA